MATKKTFGEINEKIKNKQAVIVTAEEMIDIVDSEELIGLGAGYYFDKLDNGDGTWDVHAGILGPTDGLETAANLFTVMADPINSL